MALATRCPNCQRAVPRRRRPAEAARRPGSLRRTAEHVFDAIGSLSLCRRQPRSAPLRRAAKLRRRARPAAAAHARLRHAGHATRRSARLDGAARCHGSHRSSRPRSRRRAACRFAAPLAAGRDDDAPRPGARPSRVPDAR
ncbi:MAG: hypothetical protein MZW92_34340 [Comamonadaceae bacterium]|nr:hypothetical protein [Comamonadaceae bacterium]